MSVLPILPDATTSHQERNDESNRSNAPFARATAHDIRCDLVSPGERVSAGQSMGRQHGTGAAPVAAPAAPSASVGAQIGHRLSGWRSRVIRDTVLIQRYAPAFEVITRSVPRPQRPPVSGPAFSEYASMRAMAEGSESIVVAFDTEFTRLDDRPLAPGVQTRSIDSYQFCAISPHQPDRLVQTIIMPVRDVCDAAPGMRLSLETALAVVIEELELHLHRLAPAAWTSKGVPKRLGKDEDGVWKPGRLLFKTSKREGVSSKALPVTLLGHYAHADLTTFADHHLVNVALGRQTSRNPGFKGQRAVWLDNRAPDILRTVIGAGGGLVSLDPIRMVLRGSSRHYCRPIELTIRDTKAHAPDGDRALSALGKAVGEPKMELPANAISAMCEYRVQDPVGFTEYGINDAVITLLYATQIYGDHQAIPLTISTAAAKAIRTSIINSENLGSVAMFNQSFGGLTRARTTIDVGKSAHPITTGAEIHTDDQLDYYKKLGLVPLDGAAATWLHANANAYRGGYNMASELGYFDVPTRDFDLSNCYPTAESALWDVDYLHPHGVILETINNRRLSLRDLPDPRTPFVGFVRYEFPETVAYPCIPVPLDGSMIFPRTSGAGRGVWASGPEIHLALLLGAEIYCQIGHFGRVRRLQDGSTSRMLRGANRQLIVDRREAKKQFGPKSLEQSVLKLSVNAPYGKLAQGVIGRSGWDAWAQQREPQGGSAITNPYAATMTTGLPRCVLLAALNQLHDRGYLTPSCTTDGFITDAPADVLDGLDLYGFAPIWREARVALTGSDDMWEEKHRQNELLNVTTRLNVSPEPDGVLAHGGYKTPAGIVRDSPEDRQHFYELVVTRESAIPNSVLVFPSVQELTSTDRRYDFEGRWVDKDLLLEFDAKRRPVSDGMTSNVLDIDGTSYEIAHVHTRPWDTPEEAVIGRALGPDWASWTDTPVRRTTEQWSDYLRELDARLSGIRTITERERLDRIAKGIVIAQRQRVIDIPWLASGSGNGPLRWRLELMTFFGLPRVSDRYWKHALSAHERQIEVELDEIAPWVERMIATDAAYFLTEEDIEPTAALTSDELEGLVDDYSDEVDLDLDVEFWYPADEFMGCDVFAKWNTVVEAWEMVA